MVNVDRTIRAQHTPSVADLGNGDCVITWSDEYTNSRSSELGSGYDNSGWAVFGQKFTTSDSGGNAVETPITSGNLFQVNSTTSSTQYNSEGGESVSGFSDGGFVVTWEDSGKDGSGYGIYAQRYKADGGKDGSEFRVNTYKLSLIHI